MRHLEGKLGMPLNQEGIATAKGLRKQLDALGVDVDNTEVAISELQRTKQTAEYAGFSPAKMVVNPLLNEVNTGDPVASQKQIDNGEVPQAAIDRARAILANPPKQKVWVTHGLVLVGLNKELGLPDFLPPQGSITVIEI